MQRFSFCCIDICPPILKVIEKVENESRSFIFRRARQILGMHFVLVPTTYFEVDSCIVSLFF